MNSMPLAVAIDQSDLQHANYRDRLLEQLEVRCLAQGHNGNCSRFKPATSLDPQHKTNPNSSSKGVYILI